MIFLSAFCGTQEAAVASSSVSMEDTHDGPPPQPPPAALLPRAPILFEQCAIASGDRSLAAGSFMGKGNQLPCRERGGGAHALATVWALDSEVRSSIMIIMMPVIIEWHPLLRCNSSC